MNNILSIFDKLLDLLFKFLGEKRQKEIEDNAKEIEDDPVGWFNHRYSGVQHPPESHDGEGTETTSEGSTDK